MTSQSDFDQAFQVAESAIQCMSMSADWVYHTLNANKKPCIVAPTSGELEFYVPRGQYNIFYIDFNTFPKICFNPKRLKITFC